MSAGQVATSQSWWWNKSGATRTGPSGLLRPSGDVGGGESGGVPAQEEQVSDACQDGCQDGLRPEWSLAVGPLSVAVRLGGPQQSYPAEGQVSGVPQACGGCQQVRCGSSHGKGTMGDWWSSPPPFSTLTLHTRVLTSDSWPRRMRACFWCQLRNVKFRGSSECAAIGWSRTRAETPHSPSKSVWVVAVGQFG